MYTITIPECGFVPEWEDERYLCGTDEFIRANPPQFEIDAIDVDAVDVDSVDIDGDNEITGKENGPEYLTRGDFGL